MSLLPHKAVFTNVLPSATLMRSDLDAEKDVAKLVNCSTTLPVRVGSAWISLSAPLTVAGVAALRPTRDQHLAALRTWFFAALLMSHSSVICSLITAIRAVLSIRALGLEASTTLLTNERPNHEDSSWPLLYLSSVVVYITLDSEAITPMSSSWGCGITEVAVAKHLG